MEEEWHMILNSGDLCATDFSFLWVDGRGVAHDFEFGRFVCHGFLIFMGGWKRSGTRSRICAICVPRIFHFYLLKFPEAEPAWHTNLEKTDLCAKVDRCRNERQSRPGTQTSKKTICVPKLTAVEMRGSAGLAHKPRKNRYVCQSSPLQK